MDGATSPANQKKENFIMTTFTKKSLVNIAKTYGCSSLIGVDNYKTVKGEKSGYATAILYMMPTIELCPMSKKAGCFEPCLVTAGLAGVYKSIGKARKGRTDFFLNDKVNFIRLLVLELGTFINKAKKDGFKPTIRLNGTSDINWAKEKTDQGITIFETFEDVVFYDYTKRSDIMRDSAKHSNWHITASYSEASGSYAKNTLKNALKYGLNLAVVFSDNLPELFKGLPVISGDNDDLRFLDQKNSVVGLTAKGKAKKDTSGFVVNSHNLIASA